MHDTGIQQLSLHMEYTCLDIGSAHVLPVPSVDLIMSPHLEGWGDMLFFPLRLSVRLSVGLSLTKLCPLYNLIADRYFNETSYTCKEHSDDVSCTRTIALACLFFKLFHL